MSSSENNNVEQKAAVSTKGPGFAGVPPPEPEKLKCPRCASTNTKFCYYNNYNLSQPRHFCKGCRRYWTHGGALRDIPVGGGTRKNKRSRITTTTSSSPATVTAAASSGAYDSRDSYRRVTSSAPLSVIPTVNLPLFTGDGKPTASFTSLLSTHGPAFFNLNGLGLGLQTGHDEMGFGLGRTAWPFIGGFAGTDGGVAGAGGASMMPNAWQLQGADGGLFGGDCFALSGHALN